ncbi:thioredoxin family protein [Peribacillus asahii]|uniref:thioredoxin family protein n=1 Tax=Peribacillus asahii TaxID=228899 RepID=UPI0020792377|nr:thioredoxin family protein [Peribacillus asahii]USK62300.1 thioredoxin family protein [Peribacillus asahii]
MSVFLVLIIGLFGAISFLNHKETEIKIMENSKVSNAYGKEDLNEATIEQLEDPNYQNIISPTNLQKQLDTKDDVLVYFYSPTCVYCQQTTPVVMPIVENLGQELQQYNLLEFPEGYEQFEIEGTPTIIHFKNGKEDGRLVGLQEEEAVYQDWFKQFK